MRPPLSHLPAATGIKYQVQLNLCRYILQKYCLATVSSMFIVCLHLEHTRPWVAEVPLMEVEAEEIMSRRREASFRRRGQCDGLDGTCGCLRRCQCWCLHLQCFVQRWRFYTHTQTNDPGKCRWYKVWLLQVPCVTETKDRMVCPVLVKD